MQISLQINIAVAIYLDSANVTLRPLQDAYSGDSLKSLHVKGMCPLSYK